MTQQLIDFVETLFSKLIFFFSFGLLIKQKQAQKMQRFLHTTSRHYKHHKLLFTHVAKGNVSGETTSVTVH